MAARYRATVEENRRLYNEVQDLKGNIRVVCRVRPAGATGDAAPPCTHVGPDGKVRLMLFYASTTRLALPRRVRSAMHQCAETVS